MCREKGLDILVSAFIAIRKRGRVANLKLRIGGSCGPADTPFVDELRERLKSEGLPNDVEFHPNPDRAAKLSLLQTMTVFSVPAVYGEAFGLYLIEAMAAGVPVVQPRIGAFPEVIEATGGGVTYLPGDPQALASAIEALLLDPVRARALGDAAARAVFDKFNAAAMANACMRVYEQARTVSHAPAPRLNPQPT
jgi:glycosyltransferase involved in cell wall biosynthesis